jgi:hypothetical protein
VLGLCRLQLLLTRGANLHERLEACESLVRGFKFGPHRKVHANGVRQVRRVNGREHVTSLDGRTEIRRDSTNLAGGDRSNDHLSVGVRFNDARNRDSGSGLSPDRSGGLDSSTGNCVVRERDGNLLRRFRLRSGRRAARLHRMRTSGPHEDVHAPRAGGDKHRRADDQRHR